MFKVSAFVALFAALCFTSFMAYTVAQSKPDVDWAASLQSAAKELDIELSAECMAELRAHILERGFGRGAVTVRGVLIRDSNGEDEWLCLGR